MRVHLMFQILSRLNTVLVGVGSVAVPSQRRGVVKCRNSGRYTLAASEPIERPGAMQLPTAVNVVALARPPRASAGEQSTCPEHAKSGSKHLRIQCVRIVV